MDDVGERRPGAGGAGMPAGTSRRVVHEPSGWARMATVVVAAGLVVGAVTLAAGGGGEPESHEDRDDWRGSAPATYAHAVARLGRARSFAYRGSVHATGPTPLRPGPPTVVDVRVEGAVLLPSSITREVALDDRGHAIETVTSGPAAWRRTASSAQRLADARWGSVASADGGAPGRAGTDVEPPPSRLGMALVSDVLRSARNPRDAEPDRTGRVIRAVLPPRTGDHGDAGCAPCDAHGDVLDGGEVTITLRDGDDIARVVVASPGPDPDLVLDLDIDRLGEPVVTPEDVGEPARRVVPVDALDAAGVDAVELGVLPPGWALTGARAGARTPTPQPGCSWLALDYRDLAAVGDRWLSLHVTSETCASGGRVGTGVIEGHSFRVGAFRGLAWGSGGAVSDGTTRVYFQTDLQPGDLAELLASLRPFDPASTPEDAARS